MRPVNLIPGDARRSGGGSAFGGKPGPYIVVGLLVFVLVAVSAITIFNKRVSDRRAEVDSLQAQIDSAQAQAASFTSFTSFQQVHDARIATINSLAKSRFDWERVMRELAIVIPDRVFLTSLTGTASPSASVTNSTGLAARASIPGPALELTGCARNQRTVARLIASMHDIDGVGRVLVPESSKSTPAAPVAAGDTSTSAATTADATASGCSSRPTYPTFQLVAAFDDVPVPETAAGVPTDTPVAAPVAAGETTTTPAPTTTTPAPTTTTTPASTTADGGVAAATDQSAQQQGNVADAQQSANTAAQIPSGGGK